MMKGIFTIICCLLSLGSFAQHQSLKKGNQAYREGKFDEAAQWYEEAISRDPSSAAARYNLSNSLYQQEHYDSARGIMEAAKGMMTDSLRRADLNYNQGNTYMKERQWEKAIEKYKEALRRNPGDLDAKYNLSYALKMLKSDESQQDQQKEDQQKEDQQQDQQDEEQEGNQDDPQPQGDQDSDETEKGNEEDKDPHQQGEDEEDRGNQPKDESDAQEQKRPQPRPSKLSERQAEQILQALQKEEANLQDRKNKGEGQPVYQEKDW